MENEARNENEILRKYLHEHSLDIPVIGSNTYYLRPISLSITLL